MKLGGRVVRARRERDFRAQDYFGQLLEENKRKALKDQSYIRKMTPEQIREHTLGILDGVVARHGFSERLPYGSFIFRRGLKRPWILDVFERRGFWWVVVNYSSTRWTGTCDKDPIDAAKALFQMEKILNRHMLKYTSWWARTFDKKTRKKLYGG